MKSSLSAFELSLAGKLAELVHTYCGNGVIIKKPKRFRIAEEKTPEEALQEIKTMCKTIAEAASVCCQVIMNEYFAKQASSSVEQRLKALNVANELFLRSATFRSTLCSNGGLRIMISSMRNEAAARRLFVDWNAKFGEKYSQLAMAVESNKQLMECKRETERALQMQSAVDSHQLEEIKRGFRIWNGARLTGLGENVAQILIAAEQQIKELDTCVQLFLTFPAATAAEEEEEALEWEDEADLGMATASMPADYTLAVSFAREVDSNKLSDVQSTMREGVLTITRTLLPPIRLWSDALERTIADDDIADDSILSLLRQVKTLIKELNEVVDQCSRCTGSY